MEKFAGSLGAGWVIAVVGAGFFTAAVGFTFQGGMASSLSSPTLLCSLTLSMLLLLPLAVPSSPFSAEQGGGYVRQPGHQNEIKNKQLTCFASPCTTIYVCVCVCVCVCLGLWLRGGYCKACNSNH